MPLFINSNSTVYDGTHYYFMPWSSSKPAVILHSEWEDVEFRAETFNILQWTLDAMEELVRRYRVIELARVSEDMLGKHCNALIRNITNELRYKITD